MSAPLRVGVIGVGRMGELYARIVRESPRAELVALVGNTAGRTEEAGRRFGVPAYAGGQVGRLWERHPELEAVIVATPEWEHLRPAVAALERGVHVLLEKPMAHTLADARVIAAAAGSARGAFMVCHSCRFDPRFALMREAVARGEVGTVHHIYARRHADQQAAKRILGRCHPAYWLAPHDIDLLRWVTGGEVVGVEARAAVDGTQSADAIFADLALSTGAVGRVETGWTAPRSGGSCRAVAFDVHGSRGVVEVTATGQGLAIHAEDGSVLAPDTHEAPVVHGRVQGAFPAMVEHFLGVAQGSQAPLVTIRDGLAAVAVAAAIERSLAEGRRVGVEEL